MKKPLALLAILGLSTSAFATPILVNYSGTVTSVLGDSIGYSVGDTIAGQVIIETDLAIADPVSTPGVGIYRGVNSNFVAGFPGGIYDSGDLVSVRDGFLGADSFQIRENESNEVDGEYFEGLLFLTVVSRNLNFIVGTGLQQDIDLTAAAFAGETNPAFRGQLDIERSLGFFGRVHFDLDTFSVSPRSVPEPSTLGLMAVAAVLAFAFRRRRALQPA